MRAHARSSAPAPATRDAQGSASRARASAATGRGERTPNAPNVIRLYVGEWVADATSVQCTLGSVQGCSVGLWSRFCWLGPRAWTRSSTSVREAWSRCCYFAHMLTEPRLVLTPP